MNRGATFKKADLHLHTPGTGQRFTLGRPWDLDNPQGRREFAREYVRRAREAGLDIIAITNHNDTSWIDPIREAAEELKGEIGELAVFPGVEVGSEAGESIHILAIFDRDEDVFEIERFLADIGLERERRFTDNQVCPSSRSFTDIVSLIHERGGIAIAAHAFSSENSLLGTKENRGLAREQQFKHPYLLGLDLGHVGRLDELTEWERFVVTNNHRDPRLRRERPIGYLSSSDAHSLEEIGLYYTWIKCEEVTLESLRRALLDPEARLRLRDDLPPEPQFVISALEVEDTGTGFLRGLNLEFNERLNCLVGGRGTGKSAIIELLRYLWEQEPVPARRKEVEAFVPVFFPESARARVWVIVREPKGQETRYLLERVGHRPTTVYRLIGGGERVETDLRPSNLFRLDVFGQKEVLFTSEDIRSQLDLLDRMIGKPLQELNVREQELLRNIRKVREEMIYLSRRIEDRMNRLRQLPALRERLTRLQEPGIREQAERWKRYQDEKVLWEKIFHELNRLARLLEPDSRPHLDRPALRPEEWETLPSAEIWNGLRDALDRLEQQMDDHFDQMRQRVEDCKAQAEKAHLEWEMRYRKVEEEYRARLKELGVQVDIVDEIQSLEEEIARLEVVEEEVKRLKAELRQKAVGAWIPAIEELREVRRRRSEVRQKKAEEITQRLQPRVRISVLAGGDREALIETLKTALIGSRLRREDYEALADAFGQDFLAALAIIERADSDTTEEMRIFDRWAQEIPALGPFLEAPDKIGRLVAFMGWEKRLELAEYGTPDRVSVQVNIGDASRPVWRSLGRRIGEGVSVGQGCTAILSIILLESPYPLILDQPEDDLDNRFIYDEIVQILRRERGKRQMLIATHNPNIPVAGDAELLFVLTAEEEHEGKGDLRCRVQVQGFIDNEEVAHQVCQVLDGGREAFERRRQKYGF